MKSVKTIILGLVLILLQLVVFNKIHLFGYATPLLYVMLIVGTPLTTPRWQTTLFGFCFGLMADIVVNTPGIAAASLTILGFVQQPLLTAFVDVHSDRTSPTIRDMGYASYLVYSLVAVSIFCILFYALSFFSFAYPMEWLWSVLGSTLLTWLLVVFIEITFKL